TLDGMEHALTSFMPVVADEEKALALGGVKGGLESGVSESTTTDLLEAADWSSKAVRKTAMALDKFSDASAYYTRNVSPQMSKEAMLRAVELLVEITGAHIASDLVEAGYQTYKPAKVSMSFARAEQVIGAKLNKKQ